MTSDNLTAFSEYLAENHKANRTKDNAMIARIQRTAKVFDPLTDQEPVRLAEKSEFNTFVRQSKTRSPSGLTAKFENAKERRTSETSPVIRKRGRPAK